MSRNNWNNIIRLISILLTVVPLLYLNAQSFAPVNIRDFVEMKKNYGNAVADYDLDGDLDVFIVAYEPYQSNDPTTWSRLLENKGSGQFSNSTSSANLLPSTNAGIEHSNKLGASWGDYNNDGYPDLLLTNAGSIQLYHNNGDKTFREIEIEVGANSCSECVNASGLWWDFDRDEDLDIYVSNYEGQNQLFINKGDNQFEERSQYLGVNDAGSTWCTITWDVNGDLWPDLYVINDYGLSRLYINDNGERFYEGTEEFGLRNTGNGMGPTIGDYNSDGDMDIYITNIADLQPNVLFSLRADGKYQDISSELGIGNTDWGWGSIFFDADHDGDEDLYAVNGFNSLNYKNRFFKNLSIEGQDSFVDWSQQSSTDGIANGMSTQAFDYDNDGDLDLLVSNTNDHPYMFRNMGAGGNWLKVSLEGTASNRDALGAKVEIVANELTSYRYNYSAGIMSQSQIPLHFGLGANHSIDSLIIEWPTGQKEVYLNIEANQKIHIIEKQNLTTATKEIDTHIEVNDKLEIINVAPNPFIENVSITIMSPNTEELRLRILSTSGNLLFEERQAVRANIKTKLEWSAYTNGNMLNLSSGVYFYSIESPTEYLIGKIIKI